MVMRFDEVKTSVLIVLYDYMLTSDDESFWFNLSKIQYALPSSVSGAVARRAIDALVAEQIVEVGSSDGFLRDVYALTERGITVAEERLEERGFDIDSYEPSPDADVILSRVGAPQKFQPIEQDLESLKQELATSNSAGEILGDYKDVIEAEVAAAEIYAKSGQFRLSRMTALVIPALRYLAEKFVGQSIGEIAKRLITLLLGTN